MFLRNSDILEWNKYKFLSKMYYKKRILETNLSLIILVWIPGLLTH